MIQLNDEAVSELITVSEPRKTLSDVIDDIRKAAGPNAHDFQINIEVEDGKSPDKPMKITWSSSWMEAGKLHFKSSSTARELITKMNPSASVKELASIVC